MSMMGKLNYFLELQIKQSKNGIFTNQFKYFKELLNKFDVENCKEISTPTSSRIYVDQYESSVPIDIINYQGMIGSLLLTSSHPDIMFSVCLCARYQACPNESHISYVKRIMSYLKGTTNVGLWYPKVSYVS